VRNACLLLLLLLVFFFHRNKSKTSPASPAFPALLDAQSACSVCSCNTLKHGVVPAVATLPGCLKKCINSHFYVSALDFTLAVVATDVVVAVAATADYPQSAVYKFVFTFCC